MHERAALAAIRGIEKNGRLIQIISSVHSDEPHPDAAINPEAGGESEPLVTPVRAVQTVSTDEEIDGQTIRTNDRRYLIDAQHIVTTADRLRDGDDVERSIQAVLPVKPGERLLLQRVFTRQ